MEKKTYKTIDQPDQFTPGMSKARVRQHAFRIYRDRLPAHPLTLEDWVLAEKDLVNSQQTDGLLSR